MLFQIIENIFRHFSGQVYQTVGVFDVELLDMLPVQTGFIGNATDDIARLDAMLTADFDTETIHAFVRRCLATSARVAFAFFTTIWSVVSVGKFGFFNGLFVQKERYVALQ